MEIVTTLLSVIPMRLEPSHRSEMVSQLLFGERARVIAQEEDFLRIETVHDNYAGWVQRIQLTQAHTTDLRARDHFIMQREAEIWVDGVRQYVVAGTPLQPFGATGSFMLQNNTIVIKDEIEICSPDQLAFDHATLMRVAGQYLRTPYLWGGRTVHGIDCSGFAQQVFRLFGQQLPRDAYQQAEVGTSVNRADAQPGDLAFFHNDKGRVVHVGIVMPQDRIIHAAGEVRIDDFGDGGIFRRDLNRNTHSLHSIRRIRSMV